jgi:hypothetical protein
MTAIFISYSSADNAAAAEMKAWLEAQGHTSLFLDFDPEAGIKGGSGWEQTLYQQLRQCQAVIALLTPSWLASKWCFAELVQARERGKAIFPVKVQPCVAGGVFSETIVQDTGTRDALPLLAFTLRRLYERYSGDGRLSVDEYESIGRLEGAIRDEAQRVIMEADPATEELEALHAAFVPTMVRINPEGGMPAAALCSTTCRAAPSRCCGASSTRLLVTDRDPKGRETIEVAHEALLRTWPLLGGWLAEDQDKLRLLESIQRSAEEWDQGGRRDDLLIHRNGRLKDAEVLLANPRFTMPEASVERAYLDACSAAQRAREAAEKEEQERRIRDAERIAEEQKKAADAQKNITRRTQIGLVAILLVVVLAVIAALFTSFLHEQHLARGALEQDVAVTQDAANRANGFRRPERAAQQSHAVEYCSHWQSWMSVLRPGTPFDMAGIDQANFQTPALQDLEKGYPVNSCGFDRYRFD